jgi:CRP-like cAMP-binding protein
LALNSVTVEPLPADHRLIELMADRSIALYLAWLLSKRQRRADRLLAAISSLDARGRVAMMVLDFYTRLRRRKLVMGSTYNLPLTQVQIGQYLGLTMVHVNRVLRALRDERIVNLERHCVTILDLERLTSLTPSEMMTGANAENADRQLNEAAD